MKNKNTLIKSKYFIFGIIIGLSIVSLGTYAYNTQAGTIGELFVKITSAVGDDTAGAYRLDGKNIKDNTVDNSEIKYDDTYTIEKLGIGTTSPSQKLEVSGGDIEVKADTPRIRLTDIGESNKYIEMRYQDGWGRIYTDGSNIYTNRMFRADGGLRVGDDEGFWRYKEDVIRTNNTFIIDGNVGIGTTSPSQKLEVNGYIQAITGYGDKISIGGDKSADDVEININTPDNRNHVTLWNSYLKTKADLNARYVKTTCIGNCY